MENTQHDSGEVQKPMGRKKFLTMAAAAGGAAAYFGSASKAEAATYTGPNTFTGVSTFTGQVVFAASSGAPGGPWLDATAYGASPSNTPTANTTALNNWLAACKAQQLPGFLPGGTYQINGTLTVPGWSGWQLKGVGAGPTSGFQSSNISWAGASGGTMFEINSWWFGSMEGIILDGKNLAAIGLDYNATSGISATAYNTITKCSFQNCTSKGVRIGYNHVQADETEWYSCYFANNPVGVSIEDANAVEHTFFGCAFNDCSTAAISAVEAGNGGHFNLFGCRFGLNGIDIKPYPARQCIISGCNSEGSAMFLYAGSSGNQGSPCSVISCNVNGLSSNPAVVITWARSDPLNLIGFSANNSAVTPTIVIDQYYRTTVTAIGCSFPNGNPWVTSAHNNQYGGFVTTMGCNYSSSSATQVGGGNGELPIGSQTAPLILTTSVITTANSWSAGLAWVAIAPTTLAAGVNTFYLLSQQCVGTCGVEIVRILLPGAITAPFMITGLDNNASTPGSAKISIVMAAAVTLTTDLIFAVRFVNEPVSY